MLRLTQTGLAELLGVSFASVNRWENNQSRPSALAWGKIFDLERSGGTGHSVNEGAVKYDASPNLDWVNGDPESPIDFSSDPEIVRVVAEGHRLTVGHLFNPRFATETSRIDPLPHQRIAVYDRMLPQSRLRFLLADDAGAGKTIMAGLYIREMLARRLIRRVLIVPPAGLVGNWERELRTLFNLSFPIVSGADARLGNPFVGPDGDLLIVSVDTLAGARTFARLQESAVVPYDLVVFDEAHKLSADRDADLTFRPTERYLLAEALAGVASDDQRWQLGWSCPHVLLLTATPHMGKEYPYYCLWRLLEPDVLSSFDAFDKDYPPDARQRHFIRRTKEEMVYFDGRPIYPERTSDTLSYDLSPGEQDLYDATTRYLQDYYNRARFLNRSATQLAKGVFQRRLASSTYALLRSFERRLAKLDRLIEGIRTGQIKAQDLDDRQRDLNRLRDPFEAMTADEESAERGQEENEVVEDRLLGVVAGSLADLETERLVVRDLLALARSVYDLAAESKFETLREVLQQPEYKDEKMLIFTEHRDTLEFLVRRLEGLGFAGQIAAIHGGMDYREREQQVALFRRPTGEGGATYLVATDAAGEGINLQFCWIMLNYDIPWNPARLEQRMGRIHRYGQKRDRVVILNLVAGKTREGRVVKTLLEKLELIRRELGSDKVFDVIGQFFQNVSLKRYLEQALTDEGAENARRQIEGTLTREQVTALESRERSIYGNGGEVKALLPSLRDDTRREELRRLLPGYVRRFVDKAAPAIDLAVVGDLDRCFELQPRRAGALDPLWPALEAYSPEARSCLTVYKPSKDDRSVFLHPGEPFFDRFRAYVCSRFERAALRGGVFVDPDADRPYLFHLASLAIVRDADPAIHALDRAEVVAYLLVGLRQTGPDQFEPCPVEHLLLLKGADRLPASARSLAALATDARELARAYILERVARPLVDERRQALLATLPERESFLNRGFDFQDADLAERRARLASKVQNGDSVARSQLTRIRDRQRDLEARRNVALGVPRREPELIAPGEVAFLAHAIVVPSTDPEDRRRHDANVEAIAVRLAWAHEEANGGTVRDVSTPERARAGGLSERPGFDLLSHRPDGEQRAIEVKGRAAIGDVELTENEWAKACNLRDQYWLYVAYNCASARPRLVRVQDPFGALIVRAKGAVLVDEQAVFAAAEA